MNLLMLAVLLIACICTKVVSSVLIDCHPDKQANENQCKARGCVWTPQEEKGAPWCHFDVSDPSKTAGYNVQHSTTVQHKNGARSIIGTLKRRPTPSLFGNDRLHLSFHIQPLSDKILRIFITDIDRHSMRVPHDQVDHFLTAREHHVTEPSYDISFEKTPFGFAVVRKSTGTILIDSRGVPGLTFSEQFMQISLKTPDDGDVYGMGENTHDQLKHSFQWKKWGIFTKDTRPGYSTINLYGMHPFYLCVEDRVGNSHGVFLLNSHAMEVVFQPNPNIITFKPIGGVLEFFVFMGPTPDAVVEQYTSVIGRALMPPYWAMGFNLCRWGYTNLTYLRQVFDRNRAANIPQDVQFIDLDYMDHRMDFSVDSVNFANLSQFVDELHNKYHMKLVVIVDPAIATKPNRTYPPLEMGYKMDVFVKDAKTGMPLVGVVWPGYTHWVDFTHPSSIPYWTWCHLKFHDLIDYDGIWIDMNEPSNFVQGSTTGCSVNKYNNPPFNPLIYDNITDQTMCLDAQQYEGKQYSLHSFYAYTEAKATYKALQTVLPGKRPFILSRSTYAGSGHYTNHWMGDNESKWPQLRLSIINLLEYQMFGYPLMGADICGFGFEATEELCLRWMQLGSFYPYVRNHNDIGSKVDQDPAAWHKNTTEAVRKALEIRYTLLPFLYTLMHRAHVNGTPAARPLFFEFPTDNGSRLVSDQFLWGSGLMIVPILEPFSVQRYSYFPKGRWYNLTAQTEVPEATASRNVSVYIAKDEIGLFVRGGATLPVQAPATTTYQSRQNSFGLLVALDENGRSCGGLYWDDGETEAAVELQAYSYVQFYAYHESDKNQGGLQIEPLHRGYPIKPFLQVIEVWGMLGTPTDVRLDDVVIPASQIRYNSETHVLVISGTSLDYNENHSITWSIN